MIYKTVTSLLLVILLYTCICVEMSEEPLKKFYDAFCETECLSKDEHSRCFSRPCNCSSRHYQNKTALSFQKNANLQIEPKLLCKTHKSIALEWETTELLIFLLEIRDNGTAWKEVKTISCLKWKIDSLEPNRDYQVRLWGISSSAEIFGPYDSPWIKTTPSIYTPIQVPELTIIETQLVGKHYTALIEWKPAEDRSCFYNLVWYGCDENSMQNDENEEIREIDTLFRHNITDLKLGTEYTIKIFSISGTMTRESTSTEMTYHTPTCLQEFNSLDVCAPPAPENLEVEQLVNNSDHLNETYNVRVTWSKPVLIPDNYTIEVWNLNWNSSTPYDSKVVDGNETSAIFYNLLLDSKVVDGNETSAIFYDLPLDVIYIVCINASSKAGESPQKQIQKRLTKQLPDWLLSSQLSIIVGSVLGAIIIAIFIFLLLYRRYKIRKSKRIRKLPLSNCYGDNVKGKYLWEIPNTPSEYYIPEIINDEWQLKSNQIIVDGDEILGEGAFGIVHKGYIRMVDETEIKVAIKMLKGNSSIEEIKQFEHEIEIMKSVGSHPHLVSLIGCCPKMGHLGPFLVVEYCAKGSLLSYLRAVWEQLAGQPSESRYINTPCFAEKNHMENNFSNKIYLLGDDIILDPQDLLSFARQIALGMEYLSGLRVVHRDLALRNVLMCENKIVKVADFGLSRDVYQDNVYLKTGTGKLPIKWMALESLSHQQYTTQSDVWSYGVVLWEIVTLGGNPYGTISPRDMLSILRSGYRMECPKNCSLELYAIMRQCWRDSAKERPTFHDLKLMIEELLESDNRYVSLDI